MAGVGVLVRGVFRDGDGDSVGDDKNVGHCVSGGVSVAAGVLPVLLSLQSKEPVP